MESSDFINLYIQVLVSELTELTKSKVLLTAKEKFKDAEIGELKEKLVELEETSEKDKEEKIQTWQTALKEKNDEVTRLTDSNVDLKRQIDAREKQWREVSSKNDALVAELKAKDEKLAPLEAEAKIKDKKIETLEAEVKVKDEAVKRLEDWGKKLSETKPVKPRKGNAKSVATLLE